jgi:hypothetical protein
MSLILLEHNTGTRKFVAAARRARGVIFSSLLFI